MTTTKQRLTFECIIEYDQDDDIQVTHLPEEIQAYLDSNYGEDNTAKVIRWRTELEEENNNKDIILIFSWLYLPDYLL